MATVNQSPAGQTSVGLSGISFNSINLTATPTWKSLKTVQGASVNVSFPGSGTSPTLPTTGQVWPAGFLSA
jgi:hypothetical protein